MLWKSGLETLVQFCFINERWSEEIPGQKQCPKMLHEQLFSVVRMRHGWYLRRYGGEGLQRV